MKKRKLLRNVSLVALSAVMVSGVALAATACGGGGGDPTSISVYIFCSDADKHTNNTICETWAKSYSEKLGRDITVNLTTNTDKNAYFEDLKRSWGSGLSSIADVIYLSPKFVQSYVKSGYVMDLAPYLQEENTVESISGIWSNAISYYGYNKNDANYEMGKEIEYREADGTNPAGYYTKGGSSQIGIYGLPKDYSNFSMGYNKVYFSDNLKTAYTTTKGSTRRDVANPSTVSGQTVDGTTFASKYIGYDGSGTYGADFVATYAAGEHEGEEAPLIVIGTPVKYKPFNFYRYATFTEALNAGDPVAYATQQYSDHGDGWTVTLPGFPGEKFDMPSSVTKDSDAPYDTAIGHTVFTYAEYGALVWAVTYYLNTFNWKAAAYPDGGYGSATSGTGGLTLAEGKTQAIFGSEQYEGAQGNALYLLPWLASNDSNLINSTSTQCYNTGAAVTTQDGYTATGLASDEAKIGTEQTQKLNLDGTYRTAEVQYGMNSANFIETYAAYQEFGSTWNGNSGQAGEDTSAKSVSGWDYFCMGAAVFYGAGTWDAATRNDTLMDDFEFGQMPAPVAEKYALYSEVKDANYNIAVYSNDPDQAKGTGNGANDDGKQRDNVYAGCTVYTSEQIIANQVKRQDKWAARMDSVGYAANGRFGTLSDTEDPEYWKKEGTASLIQALTIGETEQVTLTYAGAQLPNYSYQCSDFLYYQNAAYNSALGRTNAFADMITPDGTANHAGRDIWNHYYEIAKAMAADSRDGSKNGVTVSQWLNNSGRKDFDGTSAVKFDPQYADVKLSAFTGENNTNIAFAMKVLRMVAFNYVDRDLNIRMQYGVNSVRDPSMYTSSETWIDTLNGSSSGKSLAYINQRVLTQDERAAIVAGTGVARVTAQEVKNRAIFWTPAVYCLNQALTAQTALQSGS